MTRADATGEAAGRLALIDAFRILDSYGLGARVAGHLTARHPERDAFWTHRFGLGFGEVGPDDLILTDFDLHVLEGSGAINPTMHIHAQIYRARPDVAAISHTHGANVVALSATHVDFTPCSQMAGIFHDDILSFDEEDLIVLDAAAGAGMAAVLGSRSALLLRNHGSLLVGASMAETVLKTIVLEEAAETQLRAMATGQMRAMSAKAAAQVKLFVLSDPIVQAYWDYEIRKVGGERPTPPSIPHAQEI